MTTTNLGVCQMCNNRRATHERETDFPTGHGGDPGFWNVCRHCLPEWEKKEASLRLEAAAPKLLEAAKAILEFADSGTPVHPGALVIEDLRAAVKLATK